MRVSLILIMFHPTSSLYEADFCGRPKWWFRNPVASSTPYAKGKNCERLSKLHGNFFHFDKDEENVEPLCSVDLTKSLENDVKNKE